jgi:hypothetical protein
MTAVPGAVLLIAALFIRQAKKHKQRISRTIGEGLPTEAFSMGITFPEMETAAYRLNYLCPVRLKSKNRKRVNIRSSYYDKIRSIVNSTKDKKITLSGYIDNVLRNHFNDCKKDVECLLDSNAGNGPDISGQ